MSFERKMKKHIDATLDEAVPNPYPKRKAMPLFGKLAIPIGGAALAAGVALAIVLPQVIHSPVGKDMLGNIFAAYGVNDAATHDASPYPTFKRALEGQSTLLRIKSGYDRSLQRKIALTLPSSVLGKNAHYKERGNTLDAWFVYYGGCIYEGELLNAVSAHAFAFDEKIPSSISGEEVVGVYYEGTITVIEDAMGDIASSFPKTVTQYYRASCAVQGDYVLEDPHYGFQENLCQSTYPLSSDGIGKLDFYRLTRIVSIAGGKINLRESSFEDYFDYEPGTIDSFAGRGFHIEEFQPYLQEGGPAIPYEEFQSICRKYKEYYRKEVTIDAKLTIKDIPYLGERTIATSVYRDYASYLQSPLPDYGFSYEEGFFDDGLLVSFTLAYQGQYGVSWEDIVLRKAYRKGEETYLDILVTSPAEPKLEYGKTAVIEMSEVDLSTPSYDPIVLSSFGE